MAPLEINHRNALWSISIFGYLLDYALDGYIADLLQNLATTLVFSNPSSTRQPALVLACLLRRRQRWLLLRFSSQRTLEHLRVLLSVGVRA